MQNRLNNVSIISKYEIYQWITAIYDINSDAKWTYQLPPSLDLACPQAKLSSMNKTTCLWSEESINKIRTRSIILIHTRYSNKHSLHITQLEISKEKSQIEVHRKSWLVMANFVLGQRTTNGLHLSSKQSFHIRIYIAGLSFSIITISS